MKKLLYVLIITTSLAQADDGVLAINDVCDGLGCFPGDTGGLPITITNPGSYQLTSNITSPSISTNIIEINSDNVTLDLNGFSIVGPRTCTGNGSTLVCTNSGMTADGITSSNRSNLVIKNGIVKGFEVGVRIGGLSSSRNNKIDNITASENETGLVLSSSGMISDCIVSRNITYGINGILTTMLVKDTVAIGNKGSAIISAGGICSNVFFSNNGSTADACAIYTNDSICDGFVPCP